jgi:hypothetical protein
MVARSPKEAKMAQRMLLAGVFSRRRKKNVRSASPKWPMLKNTPETNDHLLIRHSIWMQVHVAELGHDEVKDVCFAHLLDLVLELEELEDVADVFGEALDVAD